jgi:hypothetical protein
MALTEEQRGTVAFDLEKARAGISHYRIENPSNVDTECALKELVDQANLAEDAIAEIERLRAALAESEKIVEHKSKSATHWYDEHLRAQTDLTQSKRVIEQQVARIKELESSLDEAEALTKKNAELMNGYLARIAELEDALVEERAKYNLSWKDCAYRAPDTYCEKTHNYCTSEDCPLLDEQKTEARRQLRAEGKIGPDARPPCWQITEGRVGLLEYCLESLSDAPDVEDSPGPRHSIQMLREMLEEAGQ